MGYIGAGISRFNTADELTVTGDAQIDTTTLVVDSTNNRVGIGTTGPSTTLQVGDGSADTRSTFNPSSAFAIGVKNGANHGGFIGSNGSSGMQFSSSGGANRMVIDSSGNVGIGTAAPTFAAGGGVHAKGSSGAFTSFRASVDSNTGVDFSADSSGNGYVFNRDNAALIVGTNNTEAVRITSGGNVGIGTSSPTRKLELNNGGVGNLVTFTDGVATNFTFKTDGSSVGTFGTEAGSTQLAFMVAGNEKVRIDGSGNVLVGTTTNLTGAQLSAGTTGIALRGDSDQIVVARDGGVSGIFNRNTSDGGIITFQKDGSDVGSIGNRSTALQVQSNGGVGVDLALNNIFPLKSGSLTDDAVTLGDGTRRFKDLYLSGGAYLGGTAAANKLDDYEEGTFTPALGGTGTTYTTQRGNYTKIGNLVYINFDLRINSIGSGSTDHFVGLPYSATYESAISVEALTNLATAVSYINFRISGTAVYGYFSASSTTWTTLTANPSYLGNGTVIQGSGVYITSA